MKCIAAFLSLSTTKQYNSCK
uniref:Uncharacterized protein n=1 Tax=Rhizophora mucronata TaxID=61149 RepID=A0A2P2IID0_RHIMU